MNNRRQKQRPKHCYFCLNNIPTIDYKDTNLLKRFISSYAKIVPRKRSGVCSAHQRELSVSIKRARIMALIPFLQK